MCGAGVVALASTPAACCRAGEQAWCDHACIPIGAIATTSCTSHCVSIEGLTLSCYFADESEVGNVCFEPRLRRDERPQRRLLRGGGAGGGGFREEAEPSLDVDGDENVPADDEEDEVSTSSEGNVCRWDSDVQVLSHTPHQITSIIWYPISFNSTHIFVTTDCCDVACRASHLRLSGDCHACTIYAQCVRALENSNDV